MLKLESIRHRQGDWSLIASLAIEPGARVAVIGPSGAGKSTLLRLVAGFLSPESGRITWRGEDLTPLPPGRRPIAMLFQDNNLFPHLSAAENVALGLPGAGRRRSAEEMAQVEQALERVGLAGLGARRPGALSGGQQGRVALARVLVQRRPLVLLDEPFAALGPALRHEMLDLVADLAEETGATLLMVSHAPEDARRIANQTIVVMEGRAEPPRPTAAVLDDPSEAMRAYLGEG